MAQVFQAMALWSKKESFRALFFGNLVPKERIVKLTILNVLYVSIFFDIYLHIWYAENA